MNDVDLIKNNDIVSKIDLKEILLNIKKHLLKIIIFIFLTVLGSLMYALSLPNIYSSSLILSPQGGSTGKANSSRISSLASFAGINIDSKSGGQDPYLLMVTTLNDYKFNKFVIEKYNLIEKLNSDQNLVFTLGIDTFYHLFNSKQVIKEKNDFVYFANFKKVLGIVSLFNNPKTGLITIKATYKDRFLADELVNIYLKELTTFIKNNDMKAFDEQIKFYKNELKNTKDLVLKEQLTQSLSGIFQKKVFSKANEYYFVTKLTNSRVSFISEKVAPKRKRIIIMSFIVSLTFGIVFALAYEFIRNEKK